MIVAMLLVAASGLTITADDAPTFARDVWPLLQRSCTDCHRALDDDGGPRKPKGDLVLATRAGILDGVRGRAVLVPGSAAASRLVHVIALPADDPDAMPPRGAPITAVERVVVERWIDAGADFGDWTGGSAPAPSRARGPVTPAARVQLWTRLAHGLAPASNEVLAAARQAAMSVEPLGGSASPLLRLEARMLGRDQRAALGQLAEHITTLDLGRATLERESISGLPELPRLVRIDLDGARLRDADLRPLTTYPELRIVNLSSSDAGDAVIDVLADIAALERVYVWNSRITQAGVERLAQRRPDVSISSTRVLAAPATSTPDEERRARR